MLMSDLILLSRRKAGLSQEDVARKIDTNRATVSCWETGQRLPSLANFAALRQVFEWPNKTVIKALQDLTGEQNENT